MTHGDIRDWTALDFTKMGAWGSLIFLVGLGVCAYGRRQAEAYASWIDTPCEIMSARVIPRSSDNTGDPSAYTVSVSYRYVIHGRTYEGDDFGLPASVDPTRRGRTEVSEFLSDGGADGQPDHCFVDPDAPTRSVFRYINPEEIDPAPKIILFPLGVFLLITVFGLAYGLRRGFG